MSLVLIRFAVEVDETAAWTSRGEISSVWDAWSF